MKRRESTRRWASATRTAGHAPWAAVGRTSTLGDAMLPRCSQALQYAAEWSDAAAAAVLEQLKAGCRCGESLLEHTRKVLGESAEARAFWASLRKAVSPHDYTLVEEVMSVHSSRVHQPGLSESQVKAKTKSFLREGVDVGDVDTESKTRCHHGR